jgi:hypothetical protein
MPLSQPKVSDQRQIGRLKLEFMTEIALELTISDAIWSSDSR